MSRGFVKETDQEPAPLVPPRAALPADAVNYVTPRGLRLLHEERDQLEARHAELAESAAAEGIDAERTRRELTVVRAQLTELASRIASAELVEPDDVPDESVRFGATVTYRPDGGEPTHVTVVGVDEADLKTKRVSHLSPIARALTGKRAGETAELEMGGDVRTLEVVGIEYR